MRDKIAFILVVSLLIAAVPVLTVAAEEPLFDTKAAKAGLEKGLALVKAKKYDAAIAVFEEAAATSPDIEAEAYYYLGYVYYLKGRSGDEDSRQLSSEFFERSYAINPSFSPNKFKPTEPLPGPKAQKGDDVTPAAAAPAGTLAITPVQTAPATTQSTQPAQ